MPRKRTYNPEQALARAMRLFWEKGYNATSMDDLVKATGVSRYGFYGTFGNKRDLFIKCLSRYAQQRYQSMGVGLEEGSASLSEIHAFFDKISGYIDSRVGRLGCMLCNTATELGPHDDEISARVRDYFEEIGDLFRNALLNAVAQGKVSADVDVDSTAVYLVGVLQGAMAMVRGGMAPDRAKKMFTNALSGLGAAAA